MKNKLGSFIDFTSELYPHEVEYLLSIQQFKKEDNKKILLLINHNSQNPKNPMQIDTAIDKRTYSYMKNWIRENLRRINVDHFYEWLIGIEKDIMTDRIDTHAEKKLIKEIDNITPANYYFMKFFRVIQHYRDYVIVRNRPRNYALISHYIERYKGNYLVSQSLNNKMNEATEKVVFKKILIDEEFSVWETLLSDIYFNETLDGYTRYRAVVRLTILYYANREFDKLLKLYDHLDIQFKTPVFFSKRILANYYANRAMLHSKLNELTKAEKFGMLSIRHKNSDYLFYLVSLVDILLHNKKPAEALDLMVKSMPDVKISANYYYKIGYASFYIKTLLENHMTEKALNYGETFLNAFKQEIFEFRWHLFFTSYITALFRAEKYGKIVTLVKRFKLLSKEKQLYGTAQYIPFIQIHMSVVEYLEGRITRENARRNIVKLIMDLGQNRFRHRRVIELLNNLAINLPDLIPEILTELKLTSNPA